MDLVHRNRARKRDEKQLEINKASHLRRGDFAGGFDEQGSRIGVQRGQYGIVPVGHAGAVMYFDF
jgi:hypothetical protein